VSTTTDSFQVRGEDDPRLRAVLQEYLHELEAGRRPDRRALAERLPELAGAMAPYLDALDMVHAAAGLLHVSGEGRPAAPAVEAVETLEAEPLGDFRIVREIGRGGMGVVYEAVQRSLGRRVALKVLPFAAALDGRQLQRFHNEAQAAAHLHHPNIVPVYAVGCERGVHFYAMQLIEGQNLAALIDGLKSSSARRGGEPTGPYPAPAAGQPAADTRPGPAAEWTTKRSERAGDYFRSVARLAAQAAAALDYAHGLGIVHRDVKPANLLLDGRGNVWVTDFGLASFHTDANLTQSGDLLGTFRYMSPEQAGGQRALIDHRTDVYALGATLYELLTLKPIFDGADRQALLRQILDEEPRPPRAIDPAIPAELETVVLKAVAKVPSERYATARELADDLQRFWEDRPITARRPSMLEQVTKWARRHRPVVFSALAALLLTVAGLSVATVLTAHAYDRERQKAREADEQRIRADDNFRQAWQAVDRFAQIGEQGAVGDPISSQLRWRLLEAALEYYHNFIERYHDVPSIRDELEASRDNVKKIRAELTTLMEDHLYHLMYQPSVQNELQLSDEQRQRLAKLYDALDLDRKKDETRQQRLERARRRKDGIAKVLSKEQMKRFTQISIQVRGGLAFSDPDVVLALGLTEEQKKQISDLQECSHPGGPPPEERGLRPPDRPRGPFKHFGGPGEARERMLKRTLEVLTPDQRRKWEELTGEPFKGELHFGGRPKPPGPRP
jgi:serine/threonine protein kinase